MCARKEADAPERITLGDSAFIDTRHTCVHCSIEMYVDEHISSFNNGWITLRGKITLSVSGRQTQRRSLLNKCHK